MLRSQQSLANWKVQRSCAGLWPGSPFQGCFYIQEMHSFTLLRDISTLVLPFSCCPLSKLVLLRVLGVRHLSTVQIPQQLTLCCGKDPQNHVLCLMHGTFSSWEQFHFSRSRPRGILRGRSDFLHVPFWRQFPSLLEEKARVRRRAMLNCYLLMANRHILWPGLGARIWLASWIPTSQWGGVYLVVYLYTLGKATLYKGSPSLVSSGQGRACLCLVQFGQQRMVHLKTKTCFIWWISGWMSES